MISASLQKTIHAGIRDESARARTSNFLEETKRILSGMDCHGFNREEVQILLVLGTAVVSQTTDASVLSSLTGVGESFIANIFRRIDEEPLLAYLHGGVIHVHDPWQFGQLRSGDRRICWPRSREHFGHHVKSRDIPSSTLFEHFRHML